MSIFGHIYLVGCKCLNLDQSYILAFGKELMHLWKKTFEYIVQEWEKEKMLEKEEMLLAKYLFIVPIWEKDFQSTLLIQGKRKRWKNRKC